VGWQALELVRNEFTPITSRSNAVSNPRIGG
jgi:hypothetical protein